MDIQIYNGSISRLNSGFYWKIWTPVFPRFDFRENQSPGGHYSKESPSIAVFRIAVLVACLAVMT